MSVDENVTVSEEDLGNFEAALEKFKQDVTNHCQELLGDLAGYRSALTDDQSEPLISDCEKAIRAILALLPSAQRELERIRDLRQVVSSSGRSR